MLCVDGSWCVWLVVTASGSCPKELEPNSNGTAETPFEVQLSPYVTTVEDYHCFEQNNH